MAIKGKRLIFCDECTLPAQEGEALQNDILPGMAVKYTALGLQKDATAATVFGAQPLVADYAMLSAGTVDDAWTLNENMISRQVESGKRANVLVVDGQNILFIGTPLTRDGTGKFRIALTDGTEDIVAVADEIINVSGADALVRVRGI